MKSETTNLAQALVRVCRNPKYSEEQAAARVAVMLAQVERAAVAAVTGPLRELGQSLDVAADLSNGPAGWTCALTGPRGAVESRPRADALEAVTEAQAVYEAKRPVCSSLQVPA